MTTSQTHRCDLHCHRMGLYNTASTKPSALSAGQTSAHTHSLTHTHITAWELASADNSRVRPREDQQKQKQQLADADELTSRLPLLPRTSSIQLYTTHWSTHTHIPSVWLYKVPLPSPTQSDTVWLYIFKLYTLPSCTVFVSSLFFFFTVDSSSHSLTVLLLYSPLVLWQLPGPCWSSFFVSFYILSLTANMSFPFFCSFGFTHSPSSTISLYSFSTHIHTQPSRSFPIKANLFWTFLSLL